MVRWEGPSHQLPCRSLLFLPNTLGKPPSLGLKPCSSVDHPFAQKAFSWVVLLRPLAPDYSLPTSTGPATFWGIPEPTGHIFYQSLLGKLNLLGLNPSPCPLPRIFCSSWGFPRMMTPHSSGPLAPLLPRSSLPVLPCLPGCQPLTTHLPLFSLLSLVCCQSWHTLL